jgi:hypothetical protein
MYGILINRMIHVVFAKLQPRCAVAPAWALAASVSTAVNRDN